MIQILQKCRGHRIQKEERIYSISLTSLEFEKMMLVLQVYKPVEKMLRAIYGKFLSAELIIKVDPMDQTHIFQYGSRLEIISSFGPGSSEANKASASSGGSGKSSSS